MRQVAGRGMVTTLVVACLLASCTAPDNSNGQTEAVPSASSAPRPSTGGGLGARLRMPATQSVAELADQLDLAVATMRDRGASNADLRKAGRFQQLAVRTLAAASVPLRREVMVRLQAETAQATGGIVRAAGGLRALTEPQTTLPRWRIVAPPPPRGAARLLPAGATSHRRALDLPGGHTPGRDPDGPNPRGKHSRRPRADAVHPVDLGGVRRRR